MNSRRFYPTVGVLVLLAGAAWASEQRVQLQTGTATLHGTLDLPGGNSPFPIVVVIAGSGPTDRDGNQPATKSDSLKLLGRALADRGIAVLRYDKRGVGASVPGPREEELRFETYVTDALQWIAWLRQHLRFSRLGVVGHSEGSLIGMIAAREAKAEAFVSIAGSGRPAAALIREQLGTKLPPALKSKSDQILDELITGRTVADVPKELAPLFRPSVQPYLISWFKYDPVREIARIHSPVLIIQGTTDLQVSTDDAKRLSGANKNAELRLINGMNHVLKRAATPAQQQAAYTDPAIPIDNRLIEEITNFFTVRSGTSR